MERMTGFEPATSCLGSKRSTTELHPLAVFIIMFFRLECQEGLPIPRKL
jgi:hypothetical protein